MGFAWIPITLVVAGAQALRTALQRHLAGRLSTNGASFTRFVFGLPLAVVYLVVLVVSVLTVMVVVMTLVLVVRMPSASAMSPERPEHTLTGDSDARLSLAGASSWRSRSGRPAR